MKIRLTPNMKKVGFLLILFFVGTTFVLLSQFINTMIGNQVAAKNQRIIQEAVGSSNFRGELITQDSFYHPVEPAQVEEAVPTIEILRPENDDSSGEVKAAGCQQANGTGCNAEVIAFQPVCTQLEVQVEAEIDGSQPPPEGITIDKNAHIEIWKVTSPLAVLSGIEFVEDNTYNIKKDNPAFRSANNMIDKDLVAKQYYPPGDSTVDDVFNGASNENHFSVHASAAFTGAPSNSGGTDEAQIDKELESMCEDIQPSHPNPDRTNKLAQEVVQVYSVPGQPIQPRDYGTPGCVYIDPGEIDLPKSDVFETCLDKRSAFDGIIGAFSSVAQWAECQSNPAACAEIELIGLMIDAPFGNSWECEEGYCADQFFDYSVANDTSPVELSSNKEDGFDEIPEPVLKAHYVTTPCKVRINYKTIYDIPCLWDVSPYWSQYQQQAHAEQPGNPDFPTWEEYWEMVEAESERRGAICSF